MSFEEAQEIMGEMSETIKKNRGISFKKYITFAEWLNSKCHKIATIWALAPDYHEAV